MAKSEEGEFELVVGNKQLLSIVFIMMVLFGVVFTMGYFVGRNSAPEAGPTSAAAAGRHAVEPPAGTRPEPAEGAAPAEGSANALTAEAPLEPGQMKVDTGTQPAAVSAAAAQPPPAPQDIKPAASQETKPPAAAPAELQPAGMAGEPMSGQTYLQVAAVKRPEAELIVDVLKKKGFPALIAPAPTETLFRVLVGPLKDTANVAKTKADLDLLGFRTSIVRKY